jgi:hypothetical protein
MIVRNDIKQLILNGGPSKVDRQIHDVYSLTGTNGDELLLYCNVAEYQSKRSVIMPVMEIGIVIIRERYCCKLWILL